MKGPGSIVSVDAGVSVAEQTRGLDWVHWLLRSVRQSCRGIVLPQAEFNARADSVRAAWRSFVETRFVPTLGPALLEAYAAVASRDPAAMHQLDTVWAKALSDDEAERSMEAGDTLLRRTAGARYQGALGHYRETVDAGNAAGHIGAVWPCVAHLFQLPAATLLAEYLRLEWETMTREMPPLATPIGSVSIEQVVARVLHPGLVEPRVLGRKRVS